MIITGYYFSNSSMNESVSGKLAGALRQMNKIDKTKLMRYLVDVRHFDFDRTIGTAEKVKSTDKRLKTKGNIAIGVFTNDKNETNIACYEVGKGGIYEPAIIQNINGELISNFSKLSWKKWIELMDEVYIIESGKAIDVTSLKNTRRKSKESNTKDPKYVDKIKEICNRYGYKADINSFTGIVDISLIDDRVKNSVRVDIRYDNKQFLVSTWSADRTEEEAKQLIANLQNATDLIHKLNQFNIDKLK